VTIVDDHLEGVKEGVFVAVHLENCKKHPVIGQVIEVNESDFQIHYWTGSYRKEWKPHMITAKGKEEVPWTDYLPLRCILVTGFLLEENKMASKLQKYLSKKYNVLQSVKKSAN